MRSKRSARCSNSRSERILKAVVALSSSLSSREFIDCLLPKPGSKANPFVQVVMMFHRAASRPMKLATGASVVATLASIPLGDFLANVARKYATPGAATALDAFSFLFFQLFFLLWQVADLNATWLCFCFLLFCVAHFNPFLSSSLVWHPFVQR